jgi:hypothetical protein
MVAEIRRSSTELYPLLEPELRRETHDLGYGPQLLVTGVVDAPLAKVGHI